MEPPRKTVGEVSRLFGVSPRMMRYYEKMGLLHSERIEGYAYRVYGQEEIEKLQKILLLRRLRLSLRHIALLLEEKDPVKIRDMLTMYLTHTGQEIGDLQIIRRALRELVKKTEETARLPAGHELVTLLDTVHPAEINRKEVGSMKPRDEQTKERGKLLDGEVRLVRLPPAEVAAIHCVSDEPEEECHRRMAQFCRETELATRYPGSRVYGFNHDTPQGHGYELWITIPKGFPLPDSFQRRRFAGGLYGAHMIPMGQFEEWDWLCQWAEHSAFYQKEEREPRGMGGLLEEHLCYTDWMGLPPEERDRRLQLDLLIPVCPRHHQK